MPKLPCARTCANLILRDHLLAALRCASAPMSTTELRLGTPAVVVVPGSCGPLQPTRETVYRLLRALSREGAIVAVEDRGNSSYWQIVNPGASRSEIEELKALFTAAPAQHGTTADRRP